jgi:hypothetical protein
MQHWIFLILSARVSAQSKDANCRCSPFTPDDLRLCDWRQAFECCIGIIDAATPQMRPTPNGASKPL